MIIDGPWRSDPATQTLMSRLDAAGHQALFVGGAVRNAVLGAPVGDVDIATDAHPERVIEIADRAGFRSVPTGIDHGTVTVIVRGVPHEVTTFRRDVATDGRRAVVAFSDDVAEDAARRDFTMNALYARADGEVVDPLGGLDDAVARHVRFIGDATTRIREDYLRILRYFRFHAWYGDPALGIDAEALAACAAEAEGIEGLSAERIGAETTKLLAAPDPAPALASMGQAGILARIAPGAEAAIVAPLVHLEEVLGVEPNPIRRLAAIGGETERLRLPKRTLSRLSLLRDLTGAEAGTAEIAWRHDAETARDVELLRAASFGAPLPADLDARIERGAAARFPVTGADLKDRFEGPEIGRRLTEMEARWIASGFMLGRDALLAGDPPVS